MRSCNEYLNLFLRFQFSVKQTDQNMPNINLGIIYAQILCMSHFYVNFSYVLEVILNNYMRVNTYGLLADNRTFFLEMYIENYVINPFIHGV